MNTEFETVGYFKDYFVTGKYTGSVSYVEKDREIFGYSGRKTETVSEQIVFKNGKKIKAGTVVITELFPINGRIKDDALIKSIHNNQNKAV